MPPSPPGGGPGGPSSLLAVAAEEWWGWFAMELDRGDGASISCVRRLFGLLGADVRVRCSKAKRNGKGTIPWNEETSTIQHNAMFARSCWWFAFLQPNPAAVVASWWFQSQRMKATESSISNVVRLSSNSTIYRSDRLHYSRWCIGFLSCEHPPRWQQQRRESVCGTPALKHGHDGSSFRKLSRERSGRRWGRCRGCYVSGNSRRSICFDSAPTILGNNFTTGKGRTFVISSRTRPATTTTSSERRARKDSERGRKEKQRLNPPIKRVFEPKQW
jgi:hypothetical protein